MSIAFATERRRLAEDELEPIRRSHFPLLQELPRGEAQGLARWLRARRGRARDLVREHRRSARGKAARAAAPPPLPDADRGLAAKKQVFAGALKRLNARLDALLAAERRDRNLARFREALARRGAETPAHPAAGPTRHAGRGRYPAASRGRPSTAPGSAAPPRPFATARPSGTRADDGAGPAHRRRGQARQGRAPDGERTVTTVE